MFNVDIFDIANGISLIGTCLGLFSRVLHKFIGLIKVNLLVIYQQRQWQ